MLTPLLTTKLQIPLHSGQHVARTRLLARLEAGRQCSVTLVSAPAGYGKTVLLSDWMRQLSADGRRPAVLTAWVALDTGDNDPGRFWSYVLAALASLAPLAGELTDLLAVLRTASEPPLEAVLVGLINVLSERLSSAALVLVLDDLHTVTAPAVHDSLAYVIEHAPRTLHLILASRADPPLPLARLRARGDLVELRANDLRFTAEEPAAFLHGVMDLRLTPERVADLEARTEGWITGLQLAALSLRGHAPPAPAQAFSGQNPCVLEYLVEEVVSRQPEAVRAFLEQVSILDRLCGPLCEAVTGQPAGAATLAYLAHTNLFTEPLDEIGEWYRCHHLFAEVLQAQLRRAQPDLIRELHRRARDWYAQNGLLHDALQHALANEEYEWIAGLIEREYHALIARGELVTLRRWLAMLPRPVVEARARSCLANAWALAYPGRYADLDLFLARAEALVAAGGPEINALRAEILALRAVAGSLRGQLTGLLELAHQALALALPDDRLSQAMAWQAIGNCHRLQGRLPEARRAFETVLSLATDIGGPVTLAATVRLGQILVLQGQLRQAEPIFQRALVLGGEDGGQLALYTSEAYIRLGDVYREWNQLDRALAHGLRGLDLARRGDNMPATLTGYFTLAHIQAACQQPGLAHDMLCQASRLAERLDFPGLQGRLASHQAWLNCISGHMAAATDWAEAYAAGRRPLSENNAPAPDFEDILLARIWLRQGRAAEASRWLQDVLAAALLMGRNWTAVQALMLLALALKASAQPALADAALAQALDLAEAGCFIRLFLDEGEPMRQWLTELVDETAGSGLAPAGPMVRQLLEAFEGQSPVKAKAGPKRLSANQNLIEPLSAREMEVLRLLVEGHSNRAIAEALFISVGTVKSHINRILGKLAAHSRTQAVAHARALELV